MAEYNALDNKAIKLAKQTIKMCAAAGSGHPSTGLSLLHLTIALMYRTMRYDPKDPWNASADRLVLSEGHAAPIIYAAYCDLEGVAGTRKDRKELTSDYALTLREGDSVLDGHPNPAQGMPFFDAATGSLGQGASVAAGLAAAARLDGIDKKIYCIIGDGESREGQIWEAADFIAEQKLHNVCLIFNCNGQGQSDYVSQQQSADVLKTKLDSFGFEVRTIDGHDWDEIFGALAGEATGKPIAIIAKTVKGWGSSELSGSNYHGKPLTSEQQLEQADVDLDTLAAQLGVDEREEMKADELTVPKPAKRQCSCNCDNGISAGSFAEALKAAGQEKALADKKMATRRAYGVALAALGANECIVASDGDVQGSTFANMFAKKYPERFFEARIAEQNMVSAGVGLAAGGKVPFVSSFAKFLVRGYDQIEMAAISNANMKLCGSHSGVSLAADGPSQMGLPDVAFMRSFAHAKQLDGSPAIRVFLPSDAVSTFKLTEQMANCKGMCYMRTHRPDVPFIYDEKEEFPFGGFKELAQGKDVAIVASGYMVHVAKDAMEILTKAGVSCSLFDVYSIPLDTAKLLKQIGDCCGKVLVVEDNYIGGVADEISSAAASPGTGVTVQSMFVQRVPKSAKTPAEMLKMVDLTPEDIADAAKKLAKS